MKIKVRLKNKVRSWLKISNEEKIIPVVQPTNTLNILQGKTALITGGNSGIGFAIAKSFMQCGCNIIIAGTNQEKLNKSKSQLGERVESIVLDVMDVKSIDNKIKEAEKMFGKIDILVNSAGVSGHSSFGNVTEEEYDKIMAVNTKGTFFMSQAITNYMISNNIKGHILNVSSSSALRPAWEPYQISKWAVRGFTVGLADKMIKHGIVVNAIAPGKTATPMLEKNGQDSLYNAECPAGRYATPEEIANLATFMVSSMGDMVVGDTFYITGGSGITTLHR